MMKITRRSLASGLALYGSGMMAMMPMYDENNKEESR
jgi:hypothetical protein